MVVSRTLPPSVVSTIASDSRSRFLHNTSPSFDMSGGVKMMSALSARRRLWSSHHPPLSGGDELSRFMIDREVTHALITPAMLTSMEPGRARGASSLSVSRR